MSKQKIYFRADAGTGIGYGHFTRSLALADMLKSDFECTMFTQEPTPYQISEAEKVCPLVSFPADESKFEKFLEYLTGEEIVVLDNYFYTTEYQQQIKDRGCKLVCIDDIHDRHFVADEVITSLKYAMLRPAFFEKRTVNKIPGSWLITIGGLDEPNVTEKMVRMLQMQGITQLTAIVGDGYQYQNSLAACDIRVLSRLSAEKMASTFAQTENVVCCASTVCYEALSQECHVYAGWYVDNQEEIYRLLAESNYIEPLGNLLELSSIEIKQKNTLTKINFDKVRPNIRSIFYRLALRMVNYVDMTESESRQVWETHNLPQIRKWMRNKTPFGFESHCTFVESLRKAKGKFYYAFFMGDELVGAYNFIDVQPHVVESGIFIHPAWQRKRLGDIIEDKMEGLAKAMGVAVIVADVYLGNKQSRNYFIRNKFKEVSRDEDFIHFEKSL